MTTPTVIIIVAVTLLHIVHAAIYCPNGSVPQMRSDGQGAIICNNPGQQDVCNGGYICSTNPNNTPSNFINVCCLAGAGQTSSINAMCPNGLVTYVNPSTQQLVPCISGNIGTCPQGATCEYLASNDVLYRNLCCYNGLNLPTSSVDTSAGQVACPNNESPWQPAPGQFVPCLPNLADNCPVGTNCRSMPSNRLIYRTLCCRDPNAPAFCSANQIRFNGVCLPQVQLGQYCQITTQCLGSGECLLNRCGCPTGKANVNGQCVINNGNIAVVTCNANQIFANGQCLLLVPPGVQCQDPMQCVGGSTCIALKCTCPAGTSQVDSICQPNANVANPCATGQIQVNGQCYMPSQIDFTCSVNEQCLGGSSCTSGACRCPAGQSNMNGICGVTPATSNVATNARCATATFVPMSPMTSCLRTACPGAYRCEYDSLNSQYICCGAIGNSNAVPITSATDCAQSDMAIYGNGQPLACTQLGTGQCPSSNPNCVRSARMGYNVCCRTTVG